MFHTFSQRLKVGGEIVGSRNFFHHFSPYKFISQLPCAVVANIFTLKMNHMSTFMLQVLLVVMNPQNYPPTLEFLSDIRSILVSFSSFFGFYDLQVFWFTLKNINNKK